MKVYQVFSDYLLSKVHKVPYNRVAKCMDLLSVKLDSVDIQTKDSTPNKLVFTVISCAETHVVTVTPTFLYSNFQVEVSGGDIYSRDYIIEQFNRVLAVSV